LAVQSYRNHLILSEKIKSDVNKYI